MKNKNEVTGNLLLGCTVLRITREVPGATTTFLLEHAAGMPGYRFQQKSGCCPELANTHTNVFSVFVFVQLYTGMAELTEYTIQVYNNCAHHARMKCTIQC